MKADEPFPTCGTYRGVALHAFQGLERLAVVRCDIDEVHQLDDAQALAAYAADQVHAPEARLFAAAKCEATFEVATEHREKRPAVDLMRLHASVVGLDSFRAADRTYYCSHFDVHPPGPVRAARRETPLPER